MSFTVIVLLCAAAVPRAACTPATAIETISRPVANELVCNDGRAAESALAEAGIVPRPGEYWLHRCLRR